MKTVKTLDNQRLIDIAMQELGDVEREFELALLNGLSVNDELEAGTEIKVPDFEKTKRNVVATFTNTSLLPASAFEDNITDPLPPGGIGYMQIGTNFIVS